ncbi:6-aminohexanoate-cyclic-dimer hydrolase [Halopseudomonas oceani]|uniref:Amidase n=1 Tax=Halopseudomonas oceani TaxID=1708783 RepID=A0A2P4EY30_9GAMM|nr:amidase [Halopseudomonas oceani]POB05141.1 amidase [Halopseudomonas oceani]GGE33472.1 6-aminohexanoate-cyclic-dimer hydrolase [Halopseudomonas oceani]
MPIDQQQYLNNDATGLANMVSQGDTSATELLDIAISRCEQLNPSINAICRPMYDIARERIKQPLSGPLAGVPILIKDAVQDYAGLPTSNGNQAFNRLPATQHSHIVRRLLDAGAVIIGKTNTPELALKGVTDPKAFGLTRNPWNPEHTPGGSSGGSAAAVAAGLVPLAGANDGGGSIRIPAACCGLFGLRPSRGRVSPGPASAEIWEGASSDLVLSRSVRDAALSLDLMAGGNPGDPFIIAAPEQDFRTLAKREPGRLRIGFSTRSPVDRPVHPEAIEAVQRTIALLHSLGHDVEEAQPEYDGHALARSYLSLYFGQVAATLQQARDMGASEGEFELLTRILAALGRAQSSGEYVSRHRDWNQFGQALGTFYQRYDLYLTPTLAHPPIRHEQAELPSRQQQILRLMLDSGLLSFMARRGWLDTMIEGMALDNLTYVPFTQLANLTGTPAMSVPLHWTTDGLPLGVQFCAPSGGEALLLQLATQLEAAQPWKDHWPAMAGAVSPAPSPAHAPVAS